MKKAIIAIGVLLLVIIGIIFCKKVIIKETSRVYDLNYRASLACPDGWKIVLAEYKGEGINHIETIDSTFDRYAGISLNTYENFSEETLYEYMDSLAEGYDDYTETEISGINSILYRNKSQIQYGECIAQSISMNDGWIYEVTFYANSEELFDKYYSTFEKVLKTVELY